MENIPAVMIMIVVMVVLVVMTMTEVEIARVQKNSFGQANFGHSKKSQPNP